MFKNTYDMTPYASAEFADLFSLYVLCTYRENGISLYCVRKGD